jgi:hypothetical protein
MRGDVDRGARAHHDDRSPEPAHHRDGDRTSAKTASGLDADRCHG